MKPVFSMIVLSAFLLGAAPSQAQVVALGASNTEGKGRGRTPDGVPRAQAYPAQLERLLNAQGCRVRVRNAGVAGDTTSGMLRRAQGVMTPGTKVLILQPGGNDARRGEGANVSGNIAAIQSLARSRGVKVIMFEQLGRVAPAHRLPDGQHFSAQGHAAFARHLAPQVRAAGVCG